eukprot:SAG22_NODE_67_length_22882_cov_25.671553_18_plen_590_part_00
MVFNIGTKLGKLGHVNDFFWTFNFKFLWIELLVEKFNGYNYFVSKGDDYDDGQTHHGCNCVGFQSQDPATNQPSNNHGFTYGNTTWGVKDGPGSGGGYCCNGIVPQKVSAHDYSVIRRWPPSYTGQDAKDVNFCNFGMTDQSEDSSGGFNALWCPINISSCVQRGQPDWLQQHFLSPAQSAEMSFTDVAGQPWWDGRNWSEAALSAFAAGPQPFEPKVYWDFCDSSFNDKLTMNDQDLSGDGADDPTFSELCIRGAQAMLVCLEMFLAAWAHRSVFSYKPYEAAANKTFLQALLEMISPADLVTDVGELGAAVVPDVALDGMRSVRNAADYGVTGVLGVADYTASGIYAGGRSVADAASSAGLSVVTGVGDGMSAVGGGVLGVADYTASGILASGRSVTSAATSGVSAVGGGVMGGVSAVGGGVMGGVSAVGGGVMGGVSAVGGGVMGGVSAVGGGVMGGVSAVGGGVMGGVSAVGGGVMGGVSAVSGGVVGGIRATGLARGSTSSGGGTPRSRSSSADNHNPDLDAGAAASGAADDTDIDMMESAGFAPQPPPQQASAPAPASRGSIFDLDVDEPDELAPSGAVDPWD